jgi:hypothetical protein
VAGLPSTLSLTSRAGLGATDSGQRGVVEAEQRSGRLGWCTRCRRPSVLLHSLSIPWAPRWRTVSRPIARRVPVSALDEAWRRFGSDAVCGGARNCSCGRKGPTSRCWRSAVRLDDPTAGSAAGSSGAGSGVQEPHSKRPFRFPHCRSRGHGGRWPLPRPCRPKRLPMTTTPRAAVQAPAAVQIANPRTADSGRLRERLEARGALTASRASVSGNQALSHVPSTADPAALPPAREAAGSAS